VNKLIASMITSPCLDNIFPQKRGNESFLCYQKS